MSTQRILIPFAALCATLTPGAAAQAGDGPPPQGVPDLGSLARRVDNAHLGAKPVAPIDAFRCTLELHLTDVQQDQGGQVDLAVEFLRARTPGSRRTRTFLRYESRSAQSPFVRGIDRLGPWHLQHGRPVDLTPLDQRDLDSLQEHANLARQLLRFLQPGREVRALQNPSPVSRENLRVGRRTVACLCVSGEVAGFPMMHSAGEELPARVKIYVDAGTDRLFAIDVTPLADGKPDPRRDERILLQDLRVRDGVLVPHTLHHLWRSPRGVLRSHSTIQLTTLELRPKLTPADFDRTLQQRRRK